MQNRTQIDDSFLIAQLKKGDQKVFEVIFKFYYSGLVVYADKILNDINLSEDIVQAVFIKIWENRFELNIKSIRSYLAVTVRNRCIDYLRTSKAKNKQLTNDTQELSQDSTDDFITHAELSKVINDAISKLPPRCKEIFEMSRFQDLKTKEISEQLDISVRTVETQISKALKILRIELKDHFSYLIFIFFLR